MVRYRSSRLSRPILVWLTIEPVGPDVTPREKDLGEFFGALNLSSLPPDDALVRKISVRRARVCAKASMLETPKQREDRREAKSD